MCESQIPDSTEKAAEKRVPPEDSKNPHKAVSPSPASAGGTPRHDQPLHDQGRLDIPTDNRVLRDMVMSLRWRQAKAKGKMRRKQQESNDDQHKRLREGRYEAWTRALGLVESYIEKCAV